MSRIEVSSSSSGPKNYTFPVNPFIYDAKDKANVVKMDTLHGAPIYQKKQFDYNQRIMTWKGFEVGNDAMDSVIDYFRSIEGELRWFNFQDLDAINERWDTAYAVDDSWKKARVISVDIKYDKGGKLKYENVNVIIQPET